MKSVFWLNRLLKRKPASSRSWRKCKNGQIRTTTVTVEHLEERRLLAADLMATAFSPGEILIGFEGEIPVLFRSQGEGTALQHASTAVSEAALSNPVALMHTGPTQDHGERLSTIWKLPPGQDIFEAIAQVQTIPGVAYAEPNFVVSTQTDGQVLPNDPRFDELYGLNNTGQTGGTADADIDAPEAWKHNTGDGTVVVGVIDTGVNYNHSDLTANMWTNPGEIPGDGIDNDGNGFVDDIHGYDFADDDGDPMDGNGHGTHV